MDLERPLIPTEKMQGHRTNGRGTRRRNPARIPNAWERSIAAASNVIPRTLVHGDRPGEAQRNLDDLGDGVVAVGNGPSIATGRISFRTTSVRSATPRLAEPDDFTEGPVHEFPSGSLVNITRTDLEPSVREKGGGA